MNDDRKPHSSRHEPPVRDPPDPSCNPCDLRRCRDAPAAAFQRLRGHGQLLLEQRFHFLGAHRYRDRRLDLAFHDSLHLAVIPDLQPDGTSPRSDFAAGGTGHPEPRFNDADPVDVAIGEPRHDAQPFDDAHHEHVRQHAGLHGKRRKRWFRQLWRRSAGSAGRGPAGRACYRSPERRREPLGLAGSWRRRTSRGPAPLAATARSRRRRRASTHRHRHLRRIRPRPLGPPPRAAAHRPRRSLPSRVHDPSRLHLGTHGSRTLSLARAARS